jgi:hypothetical protein
MGGPLVEIPLFAWVVDLVEAEDLLLVVLALDGDGGGVVLGGEGGTSRMSSMSPSR